MTIKELGNIIREVRVNKLSMSQAGLAKSTGSSQVMISRLELGKGCTLELFLKICDFLKEKNHNIFQFSNTRRLDMLADNTTKENADTTSLVQRKEQIQELINEMEISQTEELNKIRHLISVI